MREQRERSESDKPQPLHALSIASLEKRIKISVDAIERTGTVLSQLRDGI